ncbi:MAG: inorganic triphosphatase, partial [Burkholderiales bacterium PBB5]
MEVPASSQAGVAQSFEHAAATQSALRAIYFDTEQQDLRRNGMSLRLRLEGEAWIQTVKAETGSPLARLEHNVERELAADPLPAINLARHKTGEVGKQLARALAGRGGWRARLLPMFEVQVQRRTLLVTTPEAAVELVFDQGRIEAGSAVQPVSELELELKSGDPGQVLKLARQWCATHGLWLNTVSKASRGWRLVDGGGFGPAVFAHPPQYKAKTAGGAVVARVLDSCLDHVLGNAAAVAAGSRSDDHIHQLRVGLRRLRTAV